MVSVEPLSVVVPLFNGERYIGTTLDSLFDQTLPVGEVIVIVDGSTDNGAQIARDHPVGARVISQTTAGIAVSRNRGAYEAKTRFVTFLDQDDLWMNHRHERLIAFLTAHPDCRALATTESLFFMEADQSALSDLDEQQHRQAVPVLDESALQKLRVQPDGPVATPEIKRIVTTKMLLLGTIGATCSNVVERELFFCAGGCVSMARTMDDWLGMLNISRLTDFPQLDEPSVLYRVHSSSTTMSTDWSLPFLTAIMAARHGGMLVPPGQARSPNFVSTGLFWRHWLLKLARTGNSGLIDAIAANRLLAASNEPWLAESWKLTRTSFATRSREKMRVRKPRSFRFPRRGLQRVC